MIADQDTLYTYHAPSLKSPVGQKRGSNTKYSTWSINQISHFPGYN